jgi:hypothetical protein
VTPAPAAVIDTGCQPETRDVHVPRLLIDQTPIPLAISTAPNKINTRLYFAFAGCAGVIALSPPSPLESRK